MAPRVALFSLTLLWLWALFIPAFMTLRPIERRTRWGSRLARAALVAALILLGALPLCVAISFAVALQALYRPGEQRLYIALGIACTLAGPLIAWKNLTGPPVSQEEAKRLVKPKAWKGLGLRIGLLLGIAGWAGLSGLAVGVGPRHPVVRKGVNRSNRPFLSPSVRY